MQEISFIGRIISTLERLASEYTQLPKVVIYTVYLSLLVATR